MTPEDYVGSFARYDAIMRPFVTEAQKMADGVIWFIPKDQDEALAQQEALVLDAAVDVTEADD